ncbi:unnamed protein product [Sphagnum tenellum]
MHLTLWHRDVGAPLTPLRMELESSSSSRSRASFSDMYETDLRKRGWDSCITRVLINNINTNVAVTKSVYSYVLETQR